MKDRKNSSLLRRLEKFQRLFLAQRKFLVGKF